MDIKDICNAGGDILDAVADAVSRNDYSGLSANVNNTVNRVVRQMWDEARRGTYGEPTHQYGRTAYTRQGQAGYRSIYRAEDGRYANIYKKYKEAHIPARPGQKPRYHAARRSEVRLPAAVAARPAGRISGPIQLAWGILSTSGFGITALVMTILLLTSGGTVFLVLAAVFGVLTACGILDIVRGSGKIGLVNRFYRYARLIGSRGYIAVEELAAQTGETRENVLRHLRKMMKKHMFPQGRLDHGQTIFMITQEAYEQYLQAEQGRQAREAEKRAERERAQRHTYHGSGQAGQEQMEHIYGEQTSQILKDGNAYIRTVHECSEKIGNEAMHGKLSKLEAVMRRIFEHVAKHPESAEDLHKFMDYYLPTTTKLLYAYIDLDRQEIAGENISAAKKEIEDTLDVINEAFEKLLDGLFEETMWDISSDISAMKTIMAQEGLTENKDFQ